MAGETKSSQEIHGRLYTPIWVPAGIEYPETRDRKAFQNTIEQWRVRFSAGLGSPETYMKALQDLEEEEKRYGSLIDACLKEIEQIEGDIEDLLEKHYPAEAEEDVFRRNAEVLRLTLPHPLPVRGCSLALPTGVADLLNGQRSRLEHLHDLLRDRRCAHSVLVNVARKARDGEPVTSWFEDEESLIRQILAEIGIANPEKCLIDRLLMMRDFLKRENFRSATTLLRRVEEAEKVGSELDPGNTLYKYLEGHLGKHKPTGSHSRAIAAWKSFLRMEVGHVR